MHAAIAWITAHPVLISLAAIVSAVSAAVYTGFTAWLLWETIRNRKEDRLPCIVIKARENPPIKMALGVTGPEWWLRLINVGHGPAFIDHFETQGIPGYGDGLHTDHIDSVLGPDNGDPAQQIEFAKGTPADLRIPAISIIVRYRDVYGRRFETHHHNGRSSFNRL